MFGDNDRPAVVAWSFSDGGSDKHLGNKHNFIQG